MAASDAAQVAATAVKARAREGWPSAAAAASPTKQAPAAAAKAADRVAAEDCGCGAPAQSECQSRKRCGEWSL